MPRLVSALLVSLVIASPALAQVINGETPLDETTIAQAPHPATGDGAAPQGPPVDSTAAVPGRREPPPTVPHD